MSDSASSADPLGQLADDFLHRHRQGERPALTEYTERHPELAEQIRELFPALLLMEDVRPAPEAQALLPRVPRMRPSGWASTESCGRSAGAAWGSSTRPSRNRWAGGWP
jgi:hypothetical protein